MDIKEQLLKAVDIQKTTNKEITECFKDLIKIPEQWPPKDYKLLTDDDINSARDVEFGNTPWIFDKPVPENVIIKSIPTNEDSPSDVKPVEHVSMDYAQYNGLILNKIMSQRLGLPIKSLKDTLENVEESFEKLIPAIIDELGTDNNMRPGKPVKLSKVTTCTSFDGFLFGIHLDVVVAYKPGEKYVQELKMKDLYDRLTMLLKIYHENFKDNKSGVRGAAGQFLKPTWKLTRKDAEKAIQLLIASNPGAEALKQPEDLFKIPLLGVDVSTIDADNTTLDIKK